MTSMSRCYLDDEHPDPLAHPRARYSATVTYTAGVLLLCEECAARERAMGDVVEIRTIRSGQEPS